VHQQRSGGDVKMDMASVFAVFKLSDKVSFFGRVDRLFDPNPKADGISYIPMSTAAKSTFLVAGLDFKVHKKVFLLPNVEVVLYDNPETGEKPKSDFITRLTFYFKF